MTIFFMDFGRQGLLFPSSDEKTEAQRNQLADITQPVSDHF